MKLIISDDKQPGKLGNNEYWCHIRNGSKNDKKSNETLEESMQYLWQAVVQFASNLVEYNESVGEDKTDYFFKTLDHNQGILTEIDNFHSSIDKKQ